MSIRRRRNRRKKKWGERNGGRERGPLARKSKNRSMWLSGRLVVSAMVRRAGNVY